MSRKIIIMGAAGRDFHVFNCCYRDKADFDIVAFTATQIPHIDDRRYPAALAGAQYPDGIRIHPEEELNDLLKNNKVDEVVFAYSDVSLDYVDAHRKNVEAQGVTFSTFDIDATMLPSSKPMIAVCAVRTGCGKSQTSRRVTHILKDLGKKTVAIRHPMPYGDLAKQAVQRFATFEDLDLHECTIEEREEYEPHLRNGVIVYAGVDYAAILAEAEKEADVIIWDGNKVPLSRPGQERQPTVCCLRISEFVHGAQTIIATNTGQVRLEFTVDQKNRRSSKPIQQIVPNAATMTRRFTNRIFGSPSPIHTAQVMNWHTSPALQILNAPT